MKLHRLNDKSFRIAHFGLALAMLAGSASAQEQSATLGWGPARYTVIDLGIVGNPPAQPYFITNNGLISGGMTTQAATCMPLSGLRERSSISAPTGSGDLTTSPMV